MAPLLQDMQVGDKINKMYVVDGMEFLERPKELVAQAPEGTEPALAAEG